MKRIFVTALVFVICAVLYPFVAPPVVGRVRLPRVEHDAVAELAACTSRSQFDDAVGHLGVVLDIADGSWIAIRYDDSHYYCYSSATAVDSKGQWYRSREHFCGLFSIYRRVREDIAACDDQTLVPYLEKRYPEDIRRIETQTLLPDACLLLIELGFQRIDGPDTEVIDG